MHTLTFADDLSTAIEDLALRSEVVDLEARLGTSNPDDEWRLLQTTVLNKCHDMGGYWQFLALKEGHAKIFANESSASAQPQLNKPEQAP
jgi:hypothetical protein